ncbi:hypothetical protein B0H63DRAFT_446139 [Podospora didyma]|uniref:Uncharacterized protein n=1 Tax=Podospora didyma TaxID=330526 RepID=A0AAE0U471_9PEZI|nr:hypothetical protein B0H63DRAFT_446139 [Podospora didyma]
MNQSAPELKETIVSAAHGHAAVSDTANPVSISHYARGAVVKPPSLLPSPSDRPFSAGRLHFALPTLRSPREEAPGEGALSGHALVSSSLEIMVAPHSGQPDDDGDLQHGDQESTAASELPLHRPTKVVAVDLYAGRELLRSWGKGPDGQPPQPPLPADRNFRLHIMSDIYGEARGWLNDTIGGLGVTLTVEFRGETPAIMVSLVALIQTLRLARFGGI